MTRWIDRSCPLDAFVFYTRSMDDLTITVSREEYDTVMLALDVTAARYKELSETRPHMIDRAEKMRAVYNRLLRYQSVPVEAKLPPTV